MAYLKPPWFTVKIFTVDVGGTKYLLSTRGESEWVKNVRANPNITVTNPSGAMTTLPANACAGAAADPDRLRGKSR